MTLTERIAKRKADGWTCVGYVRRRADGMYCTGGLYGLSADRNKAAVYERPALELMPRWREFAVWRRTIRTKRGHSFSWALARMKEGKTVMRIGNPSRLAMREGWLIDFYNNTKVQSIASEAIEANTWELAE